MAAILVVEDDAFIREVAETMITAWGHSVFSASDADEALAHLNGSRHIHALFTDVYLKKAVHGGFDLARQAIKIRPQLRVLYTTGHLVTDELRYQFVDGASCLRKPYSERELRDSVERLVAAL